MPGVARVGVDRADGLIIGNLAPTVFVNGVPIAVADAAVEPHGSGPHASAILAGGNPTVFANGKPVCVQGDIASCGHMITTGSSTVTVG